MIDRNMIISFLENDSVHSPSAYYDKTNKKYGAGIGEPPKEKTTYEIAVELEEKYHIIDTFIKLHEDDISFIIAREKFYISQYPEEAERLDFIVANAVKNLWTDYINNREHQKETGFQSKRSRETGTATFYDTGDYSNYMLVKCNDTVSQGDF